MVLIGLFVIFNPLKSFFDDEEEVGAKEVFIFGILMNDQIKKRLIN
jgi:hypothetical protein